MKIATWNLAGIKARMPVLLKWLEANSPDILVLQETKTVDEGFPRLELEAMGYNLATLGQKSWNGVAILSKRPFDEVHRGLPGDDSDEQARLIEAVISVEGGVVRVCGIYLPNGNPVKTDKFDYKLAWMDRLHTFIEGRLKLEEPFIILGDFNIIPMPADATTPATWVKDALFQPESRARWRALTNLGMVDAQRAISDAGDYTFYDFKTFGWDRRDGIRIDHILCSPQAADRLQDVIVHTETRGWDKPSDHVPVEGVFAF
jgi:exodeoxyribonuclease III